MNKYFIEVYCVQYIYIYIWVEISVPFFTPLEMRRFRVGEYVVTFIIHRQFCPRPEIPPIIGLTPVVKINVLHNIQAFGTAGYVSACGLSMELFEIIGQDVEYG